MLGVLGVPPTIPLRGGACPRAHVGIGRRLPETPHPPQGADPIAHSQLGVSASEPPASSRHSRFHRRSSVRDAHHSRGTARAASAAPGGECRRPRRGRCCRRAGTRGHAAARAPCRGRPAASGRRPDPRGIGGSAARAWPSRSPVPTTAGPRRSHHVPTKARQCRALAVGGREHLVEVAEEALDARHAEHAAHDLRPSLVAAHAARPARPSVGDPGAAEGQAGGDQPAAVGAHPAHQVGVAEGAAPPGLVRPRRPGGCARGGAPSRSSTRGCCRSPPRGSGPAAAPSPRRRGSGPPRTARSAPPPAPRSSRCGAGCRSARGWASAAAWR